MFSVLFVCMPVEQPALWRICKGSPDEMRVLFQLYVAHYWSHLSIVAVGRATLYYRLCMQPNFPGLLLPYLLYLHWSLFLVLIALGVYRGPWASYFCLHVYLYVAEMTVELTVALLRYSFDLSALMDVWNLRSSVCKQRDTESLFFFFFF